MIIKAYKALVGEDVKLVLEGTTLDGVTWLDNRPQPSNSDVQAKITELENEQKLKNLRNKRNELLAETDHYGLSDVTMSTEMTNYRQALRDITNTYSSMDDEGFVWPTKPGA